VDDVDAHHLLEAAIAGYMETCEKVKRDSPMMM
jgi:hypothetical protein